MTRMGEVGAGQEKCGNAGEMRGFRGFCEHGAITFVGWLSNRCRKMQQPGAGVGSRAQEGDLEGFRLPQLTRWAIEGEAGAGLERDWSVDRVQIAGQTHTPGSVKSCSAMW